MKGDVEELYEEYGDKDIEFGLWKQSYSDIERENGDNEYLTSEQMCTMVNEIYTEESNEEGSTGEYDIDKLVDGLDDAQVKGVIQTISPKKKIITRNNATLYMRRILIKDDTGTLWINVWGDMRAKLEELIKAGTLDPEGNMVTFKGLRISEGYKGDLEGEWTSETIIEVEEGSYVTYDYKPTFKNMVEDHTYHIEGRLIFKGIPIPIGRKKTMKSGIVLRDSEGNDISINVWRTANIQFLNMRIGERVVLTVDTSIYNGELQYTFNEDWAVMSSVEEPEPVELDLASGLDVEKAKEDDSLNVSGVVSRVFAPHKYDGGSVCTYILQLEDEEEVRVKMFGYAGEHLCIEVGDYLSIYDAEVTYDEYLDDNCLVTNNNSMIDVNNGGTADPVPPSTFPFMDLSLRELEDEEKDYVDVKALVLRKDTPTPYQREDGSAGTRCRCVIADKTDIASMTIWGDNHSEIEVNKCYDFYNVRVKCNENTMDYEVNVDSNTRIVEDDLDTDEILENNFTKVDSVDDLEYYDYVEIKGRVDPDTCTLTILDKCPECNSNLVSVIDGLYCRNCDEEVEYAKELYKLTVYVEGMQTVLWGDTAESLWKEEISSNEINVEALDDMISGEKYRVYGRTGHDNATDEYMIVGFAVYPCYLIND